MPPSRQRFWAAEKVVVQRVAADTYQLYIGRLAGPVQGGSGRFGSVRVGVGCVCSVGIDGRAWSVGSGSLRPLLVSSSAHFVRGLFCPRLVSSAARFVLGSIRPRLVSSAARFVRYVRGVRGLVRPRLDSSSARFVRGSFCPRLFSSAVVSCKAWFVRGPFRPRLVSSANETSLGSFRPQSRRHYGAIEALLRRYVGEIKALLRRY